MALNQAMMQLKVKSYNCSSIEESKSGEATAHFQGQINESLYPSPQQKKTLGSEKTLDH